MPKTNQKRLWLKLLEPVVALALIAVVASATTWLTPVYTAMIGAFVVLGFAAYYGMGIGLYTFALTFIGNLVLTGAIRQEDVLLQLWRFDTLMYWSGLLLATAAIGGIATARRERYDDQVYQNETLQQDIQELKATVTTVDAAKNQLKDQLLATDNQTTELFELFKVLDHVAPQFVAATMVQQLQTHLRANSVVVYQCDGTGNLSPVAKTKNASVAPLTCSIPMIKQAIDSRAPILHGAADPEFAPHLVGAVHVDDKLAYVIAVDLPLTAISRQQLGLFNWFTKILGARMETEAIREAAYPHAPSKTVLAHVIAGK